MKNKIPKKARQFMQRLWADRCQVVVHWVILTVVLSLLIGPIIALAWSFIAYRQTHFIDRYFQVWVDHDRAFDYEEVIAFAIRLDNLVDRIEQQRPDWYPEASKVVAYAWIAEMAAQFQYEGAATTVNYPLMDFAAAPLGSKHNHVAGTSTCDESFILNLRFANPISTWHEKGDWIATVAHELAHNHQGQICYASELELVETTAQLMSWEVMAGLANQGNHMALFALLETLRGDAMGAAWGLALEGGLQDVTAFEKQLRALQGNDGLKWAQYRKSVRYWSTNVERLKWILANYAAAPLDLVQEHRFGGAIPGLAIDVPDKSLVIDDLLYVLEHAEELVDQALDND